MEITTHTDHLNRPVSFATFPFTYSLMFRTVLASLLLVAAVAGSAKAQARPRKKTVPYSVRSSRKKAANINPHTGKPYGAGVPEDIKNGSASYLAPSMPMRKQVGYRGNGAYNDNRAPRPRYTKPANSSLNRDNAVPMAPGKTKLKAKR